MSLPLEGIGEISGCDGFETSRARAQELGGFWDAIGLLPFIVYLVFVCLCVWERERDSL